MAENVVFREYEQRKNIGKMTGDKKYSMACKDIEKKLTRLYKRINDLQNQRKSAYKNSFQIKKKIHNQTNQIVKCYRERERNMVMDVDDAFLAQDASIGEELSNLIATHARCHTLYTHLDDFKGNTSIMPEIEKMLFSINWEEKTAFKPLEFSSNFEQAKVDANNYGLLEGDFVGKTFSTPVKEEKMALNVVPNHIQDNVFAKSCCSQMNALSISNDKKKLNADCFEKSTMKRERTDSQDSFELVDILEEIQSEGNKEFFVDEKESNSNCSLEKFSKKGEDLSKWRKCNQSAKSAKYPEMEKQLTNLQMRLENLVTSTPKFSASGKWNTEEYYDNQYIDEGFKITNVDKHDGWLSKTSGEINFSYVKKTIASEHDVCTSNSAANLIRKAFSPYFIKESPNNWLSK